MATATPTKENKQVKYHISLSSKEANKVMKMENDLMEHFGYNRSQLHKNLIRDAYTKIAFIWFKYDNINL